MKTIRQIADEIGVSKQAVYKRYKGKLHTVCAPYAHTEQGVLYLSEQAETLIKQDFLKADRSNGAHTERPIGAVSEQLKEADVVSVLQATIDTLQEQLEVKDQQIEKLTEALLAAQKTAAAAQALHAGMIQQQFLTNRDEIEEQGEVPQAANSVSGSTASGAHEVVIEGEPGDIIVVGDLVFEIIDPEEMEELASQPVPYASTTRWTNVSLSGTEMSKKFEVTSSYPYAKVWISNQGKGDIQFTITRGSDTGTLVSGSDVTIKAGTSTSVYSTNSWPADAYYANFTCGSANMKGLTSCRVASTQHELDI